MPQWNWIAWVLISTNANPTNVAIITKTTNLAQPALFMAKKGRIARECTTHPNYPLLMLPITHKDTGDAWYTL